MKKTLLALAIGSLALPLVAQAAPEFYGRLDVSINNSSADKKAGKDSTVYVSSVFNWVGIRGQADTHFDNLQLIYQIERGINLTEGSGDLTARNTYVGLQGKYVGKVYVGTYDGLVKQAGAKADLFNNTEADMSFFGIEGKNFYKNTINYRSPAYGGLSVGAQLMPGEGNTDVFKDDGTSYSSHNHGLFDAYALSVNYANKMFWANLAYEDSAEQVAAYAAGAPTASRADNEITTLRFATGIKLNDFELAALIQQRANNIKHTEGKLQYVVSAAKAMTDTLTLKAQYTGSEAARSLNTVKNNAAAIASVYDKDNNLKGQSITLGADYALGAGIKAYGFVSQLSESGQVKGTAIKGQGKWSQAVMGLNYIF